MLYNVNLSPNRNNGSDAKRLKCCDFAGWDSNEQFTLVTDKESTQLRRKQPPLQENCSESSEVQVSNAEEVDKENGAVTKETVYSSGVRREAGEVDILPGERLSIAVSCEAK